MTYIAHVRGQVVSRAPDSVVVDVGGVGYRVLVPAPQAAAMEPGSDVVLHTYLLFREDGAALYGFNDVDELTLFEQLIGVSGVGPRSALALLSVMSASELRAAIAGAATDLLKRVPGIGAKTAGRIILELQGRVGAEAVGIPAPGAPAQDDLAAALRSLGYRGQEISDALAATAGLTGGLEDRLREALRYFAARSTG